MAIPFSTFIPGELTAFFLLIVFLVVLFLYVRVRRRTVPNSRLATSPSFFFSFSSSSAAEPLDPGVLKSLPSAVFRSATDAKAGHALECAVCLSELADGELVRLLPRCRHTFHLKCIGTWFLSNSTCPICRRSVEPSPVSEPSTPAEEDVKAPALERLGSRGENSAYSSGGWDVEIGINGFANGQQIAAAREVSERG